MTVLSWDEAIEDVGVKYYGADWIKDLSHRELWLIDTYDLPADVFYPTFDLKPVVPASLREELERALDRQAWMLDQHAAVADFLKSKGYEEGEPIDNPRLEQAHLRVSRRFTSETAAAFVADFFRNNEAPNVQACESAARDAGYTGYRAIIRKNYEVQNSQREVPIKQGRKKLPKNPARK
ncbi:hypothetical protein BSZ19_47095 [Bradyrhizobium japonicum]|uniref:Uncharacterized protein n=1 Tax=Bradyrhizobium japonicum TaxID=375 RepID=A0A1Y2J7X8_BRAJP|nr:hypothetical protein [Bradyrhizobium japonicum]OSJ22159.1 hypothetical protein BSZ19_47095 [Bradyrhizobium japonicum]